jgi:hypothetical protein
MNRKVVDRVHNPWTGPERAADVRRSAAGRALRLVSLHRGWSGRRRGPRGCDFGPHQRAGGNGNGQRQARGSGGDRCGATKGTEMRDGGEQRVRCGEAEAGACFIGLGSFNPHRFSRS